MAQRLPKVKILAIGYPCQVDAGDSIVAYARALFDRGLNGPLKELLNLTDDDLRDVTKVTKAAERKRMENPTWDYRELIDKTKMQKDLESVQNLPFGIETLYFRPEALDPIGLVSEYGDEHVSDICAFLDNVQAECHIIYISGHGIKERPKSWEWLNFDGCTNATSGSEEYVKHNAMKGDISVFSCGLLSPVWLIDHLRIRENQKSQSTVVILLDSCYSGAWIEYVQRQLVCGPECSDGKACSCQTQNLHKTRLIIQTACQSDQTSRGAFFTPLWCELQKKQENEIHDIQNIDLQKCKTELQVPGFFDNRDPDPRDFPVIIVQGRQVRFFTNQGFCKFRFYKTRNHDSGGQVDIAYFGFAIAAAVFINVVGAILRN